MRTALKERQKTRDVAAYRHPRISRGFYCSAFERFFRSFRATRFFTTNTQGSAKPPPWAKFLYAFGVLNIPVFLSLPTSPSFRGQRSLFNALLTSHTVAAMPPCVLLRLFLSDGRRSFTVKMLPLVRHPRQSPGRWFCLVDRTTTGNKPRPDRQA
jgi:hypothetical protein